MDLEHGFLSVLLIAVLLVMVWSYYSFNQYATPKEKCKVSCHNIWGEEDWTCIKSCLELNK